LWLRCPSCGQGSVRRVNPTGIVPGASPGRSLQHLPSDVERAWTEARSAHSVTAYTAAEIMCRKILMHLAVQGPGPARQTVRPLRGRTGESWLHHDGPQAGGRSNPQAREHGEPRIAASTEQDSLTTLKITEHLLEAIYELAGMGTPAALQPPTAPTAATGQATVT
jgi:hypothetical protein